MPLARRIDHIEPLWYYRGQPILCAYAHEDPDGVLVELPFIVGETPFLDGFAIFKRLMNHPGVKCVVTMGENAKLVCRLPSGDMTRQLGRQLNLDRVRTARSYDFRVDVGGFAHYVTQVVLSVERGAGREITGEVTCRSAIVETDEATSKELWPTSDKPRPEKSLKIEMFAPAQNLWKSLLPNTRLLSMGLIRTVTTTEPWLETLDKTYSVVLSKRS